MVKSNTVKKGDTYPCIKALKDTKLLVLTKGPRGGKEYESDTFRLENPLISKN